MSQNKIYLPVNVYWKLKKISKKTSIKSVLNNLLEDYINRKIVIKNLGKRNNLTKNKRAETTLKWENKEFKNIVKENMENDNNNNLSALLTELIKIKY